MSKYRAYGVLFLLAILVPAAGRSLRADGGGDPGLLQMSSRLINEITQHGKAFENLQELTGIGSRLSGSANAAQAVKWAKAKMESYGLDRVWLQPCGVPSWKRGTLERFTLPAPAGQSAQLLQVTALGGSIGTPTGGIQAQVVEVHSLAEVDALGTAVQGKIVFYNQALDATLDDQFEAYSRIVELRIHGAGTAAKYGAVATVLRSLSSLPDDDHPHTGIMRYSNGIMKIPSAALSTHGANLLAAALKSNPAGRVKLELSAGLVETAQSFNVIGEITGSETPKEVFVLGGHLDSWDLGVGAQDDGAGVVQSLEAVRAIKALGLKPKRTIRVVLFMAEEFGGIGAAEFGKFYAAEKVEKIIGALESDRGGFAPLGFTASGGQTVLQRLTGWKPYFALNHADQLVSTQDGGTDTAPLGALGVPEFELMPLSTHYFDFHHSALDVLSAVDPADLARGAASMALLSALAAEQGI